MRIRLRARVHPIAWRNILMKDVVCIPVLKTSAHKNKSAKLQHAVLENRDNNWQRVV